jgi:FkbM family methyltransferase
VSAEQGAAAGERPDHPTGVAHVSRHGRVMRFALPEGDAVPYVLRPLLEGGYYEERMLEHIRSLGLRGTYVDVGAHVGTHSLWFALQCPATRVYSFEPVARFAEMLRQNIALNGADDRVVVMQAGLSDRAGSATNVLSSSHQLGFMAEPTDLEERFPVSRLDDVLDERVAVIKLDVEGMEPAVMRGAGRLLAQSSPVVFAEARDAWERQALIDELRCHGYRPTGRVFNATPTFEFRKPSRPWHAVLWKVRALGTRRKRA